MGENMGSNPELELQETLDALVVERAKVAILEEKLTKMTEVANELIDGLDMLILSVEG